ncbi:MAG: hypothetical protein ACD_23C00725G0001 [uncultured bacterium]|nr:MAG: hypothetical protein ACD_23C00725G0001 [uncultured bacterium]
MNRYAVHDAAVIPGLTDREAVHHAHAGLAHHLGRGHHDGLDVVDRIHASRCQPVVQPHGMGTSGEGLGKDVVAGFPFHQADQRGEIDGAFVGNFSRQTQPLAVVVEGHQHRHVFLWAANPQVHAVHQAVKHMGKIELAPDQLVAHTGPTGFPGRDDLDAMLLVKAQHRGHHHAGTVSQGEKADFDFHFFRCIRTTGMDCGSQCGIATNGRHCSRKQSRAAVVGFEQVSHRHSPVKIKKGVLTELVATDMPLPAGGDAFVRI